MKHCAFNYVRTHRQRHGLSTEDLARLLGQRAIAAVSQYESGERVPTLEGAVALQVIFGMAPKEMFPDFFAWVEDTVMRRGAEFYKELQGRTDRRAIAIRELLDAMGQRATGQDIEL
jgi:transcriptional regulator with XRE-family HTH domain